MTQDLGSNPPLQELEPKTTAEGAPRRIELGTALGRYVVLKEIGSGGMGAVYEAYDPELDRKVALKLIRPKKSKETSAQDGETRLIREAQAMAKLSHPNVVPVYDVGSVKGVVFVAMEYVRGVTLRQWKEGDRSWRDCVDVLSKAGRGLATAHAANLIHRDFKPGNVMIGDDGRVRVLDFGLASLFGAEGSGDHDEPSSAAGRWDSMESDELTQASVLATSVTRTGEIMGTPAYMSPEQFRRRDLDGRSDQFSFCVVLHELLYGQRPFRGKNAAEIKIDVIRGRVPSPPANAEVPLWLRRVVLRGLAVDPAERWASMDRLLSELARDPGRRVRNFGMAAAVLAAVAGGSAWLSRGPSSQQLCDAASGHLSGVWDADTKAQLSDVFETTRVPYASATWARVSASLDDYSERWVRARTQACEATVVRHEQSPELMDLRMACLDRSLWELEAVVTVLAQTEASSVEKADEVVDGLADLERCSDAQALRSSVKEPTDAATREQVARVREGLASVKALQRAGLYKQSLAEVVALSDTADKIGYRPLVAETSYWRGRAQSSNGDYAAAERDLADAAWTAQAVHLDTVAADAQVTLVDVVGYRLARPEDGLLWADHARAALERAGEGFEDLDERIGNVYLKKGEYDEALESLERVLAAHEDKSGPDSLVVARLLVTIGAVERRLGKLDTARSHHGRALELLEQQLGPDHPTVAKAISNLGLDLFKLGEYEPARAHFERALAMQEARLGPDHPEIASHLNNLGTVTYRLGDYESTGKFYERSLALRVEQLGPEHPQVGGAMVNLANLRVRMGRYDEARGLSSQAIEILENGLGPKHPSVATTLISLARIMRMEGDLEPAEALCRRAIDIRIESVGADHADTAQTRSELGWVLLEKGSTSDARSEFQAAHDILREQPTDDALAPAEAAAGLGASLLAQGRTDDARPLLETALEAYEDPANHPDPVAFADLRFAYAKALGRRSKEAVGLARKAVNGYPRGVASMEPRRTAVERWLASATP